MKIIGYSRNLSVVFFNLHFLYSEREIGLELLHGIVIPETYKNILGQHNDWDDIFLKSKGQQHRMRQPMPK